MKNKLLGLSMLFCMVLGSISHGYAQTTGTQNFYTESAYHQIKALEINSVYSDLGAFPWNEGVIFMSNRSNPHPTTLIKLSDPLTGNHFYSLYFAPKKADDSEQKIELYAKELSGKYNNGPVFLNEDGTTLLVTKNILKKKEAKKNKSAGNYLFVLQLFEYKKDGDKWGDEKAFSYNSNSYNCAHATMTKDGQTLYFSSDMPGGIGGMDIYKCKRQSDGSWSNPENLGATVNSIGNEIFPNLSKENDYLYFSSNKQGGMGGLDLYSVSLNKPSAPKNMGAPINSQYDDFGLIYTITEEEGYFCSNRPLESQDVADTKDSLNDNIYSLKSESPFTVIVVDKLTQIPIAVNVSMVANDDKSNSFDFVSADKPQRLHLKPGKTYQATVAISGFENQIVEVKTTNDNHNIVIPITLDTRIQGLVKSKNGNPMKDAIAHVTSGTTDLIYLTDEKGYFLTEILPVGKIYQVSATRKYYDTVTIEVNITSKPTELRPLYTVVLTPLRKITLSAEVLFDFDKYDLRPEAKAELDSIIPIMLENRDIKLTVGGYTDSRGSESYNQKLSERRANSVRQYMIEKGVTPNRITSKGYGLSRLVNKCKKGVKCTEAEHQENRRVEFLFTDIPE